MAYVIFNRVGCRLYKRDIYFLLRLVFRGIMNIIEPHRVHPHLIARSGNLRHFYSPKQKNKGV